MLTKIKIYSIISMLLTVLFLFVGCNGSSTATNGLDGNDGKDGKNGTSWYSGEGSPAEKDLSAALGDFYLDTATCDIYVLNESGWSFSVNIKGNDAEGANPDNSNGTSVGKGSEFITGEGEPVSNLGNNGDLYIDLKSKDVWYKKNESWTVIGNMGGKISKQNWNDDGALKILFIGNSFSVDTAEYIYPIAKNLGVEKIKIGNLYIGGCSIDTHLNNVKNNSPAYKYYVNETGSWYSYDSFTVKEALESENWDFISYQQASGVSGIASSYVGLSELVSLTEPLCPRAKLVFNMTWAYDTKSSSGAFVNYDSNQKTMYSAIAQTVKEVIHNNESFYAISYTGTAIQNARASVIGDNVTRDGLHLSNFGRYVAAVTFLHTAVKLDVDGLSYVPNDYPSNVYNKEASGTVTLSEIGITVSKTDAIEIAKNAVKDAAKEPFDSEFKSGLRRSEVVWYSGRYKSDNNEYYYKLSIEGDDTWQNIQLTLADFKNSLGQPIKKLDDIVSISVSALGTFMVNNFILI